MNKEVKTRSGGTAPANWFKAFGFFWIMERRPRRGKEGFNLSALGPYCSKGNCGYELSIINFDADDEPLKCDKCGKNSKIPKSINLMAPEVKKLYEAESRIDWDVKSLDTPPTDIKVKDEDDKYWLGAKIGNVAGKRIGVVYFGEKKENQTKKDYAQLFIDLDLEQLRFDPTNKNPLDDLSTLTAEFKNSTVSINSKAKHNKT